MMREGGEKLVASGCGGFLAGQINNWSAVDPLGCLSGHYNCTGIGTAETVDVCEIEWNPKLEMGCR